MEFESLSKDLTNEEVISILLHAAVLKGEQPTIRSLSEKIKQARECGLPTGTIALRPVPEGYYSEHIAEYAAILIEGGIVEKKNPLIITDEGKKWLKEFVEEIKAQKKEKVDMLLRFLQVQTT